MTSEQESNSEELIEAPVAEAQTAGQRLREAREEKRLDLSHVAAETRIPVRHLETIETGSYDKLPSRTYAIGFARTYARVVGLNEAEIADLVRDELAGGYRRQSALAGGMEPGDPAKLPSAGLAWFGAIAALILAVGIYAFYNTYFGAGDGLASLIAESAEEGASEDEIAASEAGGDTGTGGGVIDSSGQVVFTALEDGVWVRFYDSAYDETREPLFEGTMASGDTFELSQSANGPRINTGRPDALAITVGGQKVPKLADEPITLGDTQISAAALLARAEASDPAEPAAN
ncbi:helix-turn-helix domain-containing protein [Erythrobacter crassostreae]|uniref:Helix-turn-helix domain-containing protein n=1 Tax=Erythrobacter crassostreae TaxID=2828328 RepID=A0A9X1F2J9_9SPHN|nr:helix-turn-helix domain-containing protein [Erythrobacter crassostrea]MBV7259141.1 helix-turn-helix domain-containing protein [Erythrobacter crassostrea]